MIIFSDCVSILFLPIAMKWNNFEVWSLSSHVLRIMLYSFVSEREREILSVYVVSLKKQQFSLTLSREREMNMKQRCMIR
jgi:hypothetical protein